MIEATRLQPLQSSLGTDGYQLEARQEGSRIAVRISASADACADCLVPKNMMRSIIGQVLGVAEDIIDVSYPGEPSGPPPGEPVVPR
jgi:hypothetical protein